MNQYRCKIEYDGRYTYSFGYAMYSAFLERLAKESSDIAQTIHEDSLFNQCITPKEWVINTAEELPIGTSYYLQKYNVRVKILKTALKSVTEQQIADSYLVHRPFQKKMRIFFETPSTFKQEGAHVLYPTEDLIMQSLTNKWNNWAEEFVLEDIQWDACRISRYNLRSAIYHLKGAIIQGFVGYVDMQFWGAESMIRLANMVCHFGNYSGIGVKAALGMGGIKVE